MDYHSQGTVGFGPWEPDGHTANEVSYCARRGLREGWWCSVSLTSKRNPVAALPGAEGRCWGGWSPSLTQRRADGWSKSGLEPALLSSPRLRARCIAVEGTRVLRSLKATFPLPQGLERLCGVLPSNYAKPREMKSVTLCLVYGEWPAGAATGQEWEPPSAEEKSGLILTGEHRKLYYSDEIDSPQLIFTKLTVLNSDLPAGRGFCNSLIRRGFEAPVQQLFCG